MKILAYSVTADWCEASVIVFADRVSAAKAEAHQSEWLCDFEWTELRARRIPKADKYAEIFGRGALDFSAPGHEAVARELGWYELEGSDTPCAMCGLYSWHSLSESKLNDDGVCGDCLARADALKLPESR